MLSLNERTSAGLLRHFYAFLKKYRYVPYVRYKLNHFIVKLCKNYRKLFVKKKRSCTIRILGRHWLQDRIRQNSADPTGSGSAITVKTTPLPLTVLSRLGVDVCVVAHGAELSQRVISAKQEEEEGRAILQMSARSRARKQPVHTTYISHLKRHPRNGVK
jgi:hypothetical protein